MWSKVAVLMPVTPISEDTAIQPATEPGHSTIPRNYRIYRVLSHQWQRMLAAMRLTLPILLPVMVGAAVAQTADRSAAPSNPSTTAPAARTDSYSVQNGELVVAPGLRIPNGNVPWALDTVDGKQVLVPIHHTPLTGTATSGTLEGPTSHTPLHSATPAFFIHTSDRTENSGDSGRGTPTGWALLSAPVADSHRTVARPRFTDVNSATVCTAPVICTTAESLPDGWLRVTPQAPLTPGEYALLPIQKTLTPGNTLAYDFTVDGGQGAARDTVAPGQNLDTRKKKR
ncbi:hypothetical protein [Terriglobus sp. TAA 43]|uniref:hypothetical protein n=1 Tax=Terriglobus sp. TAA 43 TaxID=278961 RepID=UPI0012EE47CD|nr:hypothetical protein [Terriglobus sp. TAA 43]